MKAKVDPDICGACGVCEEICPEVFEMVDNIARVKVDPVPEGVQEQCQDAADECPAGAIEVED